MKRALWVLICLMAMCYSVEVFSAKVEKTVTLTVNGKSRSYLLYVPNNVKENAPLVFSLHGTGGSSSNKAPMRTTVADAEGFIVVYPQGSNIYFPVFGGTLPGWNSTGENSEDIDFFKAIIEDVAKIYTIDRKRIYCCGFSNGGMMTYSLANTSADLFAAFASISGFQLNEFHLHHTGVRPVPFLHIHGKNDNFVDIARMPTIIDNMVARVGANPVPVVTKVSGKYTKSVYEAKDGGFPYIYYVIEGMGHEDFTNKTEDGSSAQTMWNFMKQYTLYSPCDETLKWRPSVETEGYKPAEHGWVVTTKGMVYGDDPNSSSKNIQNVYHSFQLAKGNYKLCFKSQSDEEGTVTVTIKKYTGDKSTVLNQTLPIGGDATMVFTSEDEFAECRFKLSATTNVTITDLALYTPTVNEMLISEISSYLKEHSFTYTGDVPIISGDDYTIALTLLKGYTAKLTMPELHSEAGTYDEIIPAIVTDGKETYTVYVPYTYSIEPVKLTVRANNASRLYGEEIPQFSVSYTGFVNGENESVLTSKPIATTTAHPGSNVGTYPITVSGGKAKNYTFEYEEGILTVNKASLIINVEETTKVYGKENPTFSLNFSGLKNGETAPAWKVAPTFTTVATKTSDVGTYSVHVTCNPQNYEATIVSGKLNVTQAPLTIGVKNATRPYCGNEPEYTYTYSGFVNGDNESVLIQKPTIQTEANATSNVGSYTITPTGAQAKNYDINYTDGTLNITQIPLTVKAVSATRDYGKENPAFSLTYEGFVNDETKDVLLSQPTVSTSANINSNAGTYDIQVSGGRAFNYALNYESGKLTINPVPLKIFVGNYERPYNEENPRFDLIYEGFVASDTEASLQNKPVVRTTATKTSIPGTYALEVAGAYSPNYTITYESGMLTIVKAEQSLEWEQDLYLLKVNDQIELKAIAESGLPITYTMSEVDGAELYPAGNKTYLECKSPCEFTITAVQNGNANYYSTPRITKKVKIVAEEDYDIHHITYIVDGLPYKVVSYATGEAIIAEKAPTKEGYTFSGWSLIPATMPAKNITVTGTFSINSYTLTYLVDGETYKTYKLDYGAHITPEAQPKKDGYTFSGWDMVPANMPANDVTVNGYFTLIDDIEEVIANDDQYQIYALDGMPIETLQKGVNIIKYKNGKVKKVVVK